MNCVSHVVKKRASWTVNWVESDVQPFDATLTDAQLVEWFTHGAVDAKESEEWQEMISYIIESVLPPRYGLRKDGNRYTTETSFPHAEAALLHHIASIDTPVDGDRIGTSDKVSCYPCRAYNTVMSKLHGLNIMLPPCQWLSLPLPMSFPNMTPEGRNLLTEKLLETLRKLVLYHMVTL